MLIGILFSFGCHCRYDLNCKNREGDVFHCEATYSQMLFRYTDANKAAYIKECGKVFHNHFQDTSYWFIGFFMVVLISVILKVVTFLQITRKVLAKRSLLPYI